LTRVDARAVKAGLALIILAFATWSLTRRVPLRLERDRLPWLLGCGLFAGVLGGAYGMNGPPLAVYGSLRRWSPERFRASLQGYFLPASIVGLIGYWVAGLWTPTVTRYFVMSLPSVLAGIPVGRTIAHRLDRGRFAAVVRAGLLASGVTLLLQALAGWNG
jgi:uncharacterized membrane protein YfcA